MLMFTFFLTACRSMLGAVSQWQGQIEANGQQMVNRLRMVEGVESRMQHKMGEVAAEAYKASQQVGRNVDCHCWLPACLLVTTCSAS